MNRKQFLHNYARAVKDIEEMRYNVNILQGTLIKIVKIENP